jgi:hypothetical protein
VETASSGVQGALESMVAPPATGEAAAAPAASGGGGGASYQFGPGAVVIQGGGTAQDNVDAFAKFLEMLEAGAIQIGAAVPA